MKMFRKALVICKCKVAINVTLQKPHKENTTVIHKTKVQKPHKENTTVIHKTKVDESMSSEVKLLRKTLI